MGKLMLLSRTALRAFVLAFVLPVVTLTGCAIRDRMTGETEARRIREVGVAAPATVVKIWDTGITVNNDPVVGFLLDVKPEGQAPFQAKTKALVSRLAVPRVQPGAQLKVMYDPKDTTRVALDPVH